MSMHCCVTVINQLTTDYLKHLPNDSNDRVDSESILIVQSCVLLECIIRVTAESLELISKVAVHVNESMKQVDNFKKLMEVQKRLIGDGGNDLISPSRVS